MLYPTLYVNGRFVPKEEALIPVYDLGLLRGLGVFDFFRVLDGVPIFVEDHVARLQRSLAALEFRTGKSDQDWVDLVRETIRINEAITAGFRIVVTGGFSEDGYSIPEEKNIYMMVHPLAEGDHTLQAKGVHLITTAHHREMAQAKTTIYVKSMTMLDRLRKEKAYEVLFHWDGQIFECSRSNIFFIDAAGELHTPGRGMLLGITRKQIIELARAEGIRVHERDIRLDEVSGMAGAFLTATTRGALPVTSIDDRVISQGVVHPLVHTLNRLYDQRVKDYIRQSKGA